MATNNTDFDPQEVLTKNTFTIPVDITDRDDEGKEIVRQLLVTYHYDQDTQDEFRAGVETEVDNPKHEEWENANKAFGIGAGEKPGEEPPAKLKMRRDFNNEEQIRKLVKKIKGVPELSDEVWRQTPPKHKVAILEAVMEDIFPNMKSSGA